MKRIYGTTITPTIAASKQHLGAFAADDVLFDWVALKIPKNAVLDHVSYLAPGVDNVGQQFGVNFLFAKNNNVSLGTVHANCTGHFERDQLIGVHSVAAADRVIDISEGLHRFYHSTIGNPSNGVVFADYDNDLDVGTNAGYVTVYVGATLVSGANLSTGVTVNNGSNYAAGASTTIITADEDADKTIRPGHVIHAQDDAVLGTVASVTANLITLTAVNVGALTDDDELYIVNPIKFNFGFTTY